MGKTNISLEGSLCFSLLRNVMFVSYSDGYSSRVSILILKFDYASKLARIGYSGVTSLYVTHWALRQGHTRSIQQNKTGFYLSGVPSEAS